MMAGESEVYFDFERLNVYDKAMDFIDHVFGLCRRFNRDYTSSIGSRLQRAAISIATNIAEGCGKTSRRERIRYFSCAMDSVKECIPCLTIASRLKQITDEDNEKTRNECTSICRMLAKLIRSVENEELKREH